MNLPNKLTVTRLLMVPLMVIVYLLPYERLGVSVPSFQLFMSQVSLVDVILFIIFALASITDFFDGYLARKNNLVTTFGKFVDPIADKLIVNTTFILLGYSHTIPIWVVIVMIARDTIVDAVRFVAASQNIVLAASQLGKLKTMSQMIGLGLVLLHNPFLGALNIPFDQIVIYFATVVSVLSGLEYLKNNWKYITETM